MVMIRSCCFSFAGNRHLVKIKRRMDGANELLQSAKKLEPERKSLGMMNTRPVYYWSSSRMKDILPFNIIFSLIESLWCCSSCKYFTHNKSGAKSAEITPKVMHEVVFLNMLLKQFISFFKVLSTVCVCTFTWTTVGFHLYLFVHAFLSVWIDTKTCNNHFLMKTLLWWRLAGNQISEF